MMVTQEDTAGGRGMGDNNEMGTLGTARGRSPNDIRRPPLAAVRSEHLATFPDAGPREEGTAADTAPAPRSYDAASARRQTLQHGNSLGRGRSTKLASTPPNRSRRTQPGILGYGRRSGISCGPSSRGPASGNVARCSVRTAASGGRRTAPGKLAANLIYAVFFIAGP